MLIVKHRSIDLKTSEVLDMVEDVLRNDARYPGIAFDITEDYIALSPEDTFVFDPTDDPNYEVIIYEE